MNTLSLTKKQRKESLNLSNFFDIKSTINGMNIKTKISQDQYEKLFKKQVEGFFLSKYWKSLIQGEVSPLDDYLGLEVAEWIDVYFDTKNRLNFALWELIRDGWRYLKQETKLAEFKTPENLFKAVLEERYQNEILDVIHNTQTDFKELCSSNTASLNIIQSIKKDEGNPKILIDNTTPKMKKVFKRSIDKSINKPKPYEKDETLQVLFFTCVYENQSKSKKLRYRVEDFEVALERVGECTTGFFEKNGRRLKTEKASKTLIFLAVRMLKEKVKPLSIQGYSIKLES